MANLAEAVDTTETDWIISADLDDDIDYLTVESEIVHVTANFPTSIDPQTRSSIPPRIRVERAAGGTTAATHADATALTALIPPAAAGEGGGAIPDPATGDDGDVPTVQSGAYALAPPAAAQVFVSDDDPGAVGARNLWLQTNVEDISAEAVQLWVRNDADTGWIAAGAVIATDGVTYLDIVSPSNTMHLEFDEASGVMQLRDAPSNGSELRFDGIAAAMYAGTGRLARMGSDTGNHNLDLLVSGALELDGDPVFVQTSTPEVPATPTEQDIVDALVTLGLVTQAAP